MRDMRREEGIMGWEGEQGGGRGREVGRRRDGRRVNQS